MDHRTLDQRLKLAERHVAAGWRNLARQMHLVADMNMNGKDITLARRILLNFEDLMDQYLASRDRLKRQLSRAGKGH